MNCALRALNIQFRQIVEASCYVITTDIFPGLKAPGGQRFVIVAVELINHLFRYMGVRTIINQSLQKGMISHEPFIDIISILLFL